MTSILTHVGVASSAGMMAVTFTHPLELTKTRLQLDQELIRKSPTARPTYRGWLDCVASTLQKDGLRGLQRGLSVALLREAVFNGARIGLYDPLLSLAHTQTSLSPSQPPLPSFGLKLTMGLVVGALAAALCNPLDLLKIRLQSLGGKTGFQHQATHPGILRYVWQVVSQEGLTGLYKGVSVNITRGILGPGTQLPVYNALKENEALHQWLHTQEDGWRQHTVCALGSAAVSILCVNPIDVIRTRLYNQPWDNTSGNGLRYRHGTDAALKIIAQEGPLAFYKGGLTHFGRLGPHMVLVFVFFEQLKRLID